MNKFVIGISAIMAKGAADELKKEGKREEASRFYRLYRRNKKEYNKMEWEKLC